MLFTVGHSNLPLDQFLGLFSPHRIEVLATFDPAELLLCPISTPTPIASSKVATPAIRLNPADVRGRRGGRDAAALTLSVCCSGGSASVKRGLPRRSPQLMQ